MNRTDLQKPFDRIIKLSSVMQATEFENRFQYWSRSQLLNLQFFINQYNSFWSESTLTRKVLQGSIISFLLHTLLFLIMSMTCLKQLIDISYYILIIPVFLNLQMWKKLKKSFAKKPIATDSWIMKYSFWRT